MKYADQISEILNAFSPAPLRADQMEEFYCDNTMERISGEDCYCSLDLDLFNIVYSDLFILMGEALLKMAEELECEIDDNVLENIKNFWFEGTGVDSRCQRVARMDSRHWDGS